MQRYHLYSFVCVETDIVVSSHRSNSIDVSLVLTSELCDKAIDIIPLQFCIYQLKRDISPALHVMALRYCNKF